MPKYILNTKTNVTEHLCALRAKHVENFVAMPFKLVLKTFQNVFFSSCLLYFKIF